MLEKKFLKDAKEVFNELERQSLLTEEEESILKTMANRLKDDYEEFQEEQEQKKTKEKKKNKLVTIDEKSILYANQVLLYRAILKNDASYKETFRELIANLLREEWERCMKALENVDDDLRTKN